MECRAMSIGVSVFLIALGAIFSFAITADSLGFLDLNVLGYILMAAGVIGLAATLYLRQRKRVRVLKNGKTIEETTTDV
jgi:asparagine N-glycosylation enzyme membrane subunit Stt3